MTFELDYVYNRLGLRIISDKENTRIIENLSEFYDLNKCSLYNPNISYFTNFTTPYKLLNNNNKLFRLIKKKRRISTIGYFCKAMIKTKNNKMIHKSVFVKEISIFDPNNIDLFYDYINNINQCNLHDSNHQMVTNMLYNLEHYSNIEIFVNYLTSKLVELQISPHFCEYYGAYSTNMKKFTYDVSDIDSIIDNLDHILSKNDNIKCFKEYDNIYLEYQNIPAFLLITETIQYDIDYLRAKNLVNYDLLLSLSFQLFSAISTMNSIFGIKHNDLHFGNIMINTTNDKFIYYKFNNIYYKVPTYGYIIKIIDWGRSTYAFNGCTGKNDIFKGIGECFEQYIYKRINGTGLPYVNICDNDWTDIIMSSQCFLYEYKDILQDTDLGRLLNRLITTTDKDKLDICSLSWDLYVDITNMEFKINPRDIFTNRVYSVFKIKQSKVRNIKVIYDIVV